MNMISVTPAAIQLKYVGESEKTIQALFSQCTKLTPCIFFIDEADSLFFKRTENDKSWDRSLTNQFLQEIDRLNTKKDTPFVLVATNRPEDLDEAFLRRLPQEIEFKQLPSKSARKKILDIFLKDTALHPDINTDTIAEWTEGFSGSDLQSFCIQSALIFSSEERNRHLESGSTGGSESLGLTSGHFSEAFKRTYKSECSEGNTAKWQPTSLIKHLASRIFQITCVCQEVDQLANCTGGTARRRLHRMDHMFAMNATRVLHIFVMQNSTKPRGKVSHSVCVTVVN